jgi:FkbM family methyltransferase
MKCSRSNRRYPPSWQNLMHLSHTSNIQNSTDFLIFSNPKLCINIRTPIEPDLYPSHLSIAARPTDRRRHVDPSKRRSRLCRMLFRSTSLLNAFLAPILLIYSILSGLLAMRLQPFMPSSTMTIGEIWFSLLHLPALCVDPPFWQQNSSQAFTLIRQYDFIVSFQSVRMYLPYAADDLIQHMIVEQGNFFESDIFPVLAPCIPPDAVVFDVGANIGNHALYWALKSKAKKVYAFEPIASTFSILKRNVALNGLENVIIPINAAVSDQIEKLSLLSYSASNTGGTELRKDQEGTIKAITLDSFEFPEQKVDFVKIDVETFECHVIRGGMNFLAKFHPAYLFIEVRQGDHMTWVNDSLATMRYEYIRELSGANYLWGFVNRSQ